MPRMYPAFMYRDKEPMGTNMAYRLLPHLFNADITLASKKMYGLVNALSYAKSTVYISIGKNIILGDEEFEQLLSYVRRGNEFFISGNNIDYRLLDTLGIKHNYEDTSALKKQDTFLQIADTTTYSKKKYGFFFYPFSDVFNGYDSSTTKVLGVNDKGRPDYIVVRYGKGKFYFHLAPTAFTNYFLLTAGNTDYFNQVFSYLSKDATAVYWADTDKFGKSSKEFSALSIFWKNPPLMYAMLLACTFMLLYIAFESKRKRRLVPPLEPNINSSLSFVQTIGNLYLQKKDNRNIAVKMVSYFFEHVRSNYHLNTHSINAEFIQSLAGKSGVAEATVKDLLTQAEYINQVESITDQELFHISNLIYEFYKR